MAQKIRKAIFPVGGMGTRFLPATKSMPKEMLPVVDKPLVQYAFEEARDSGIEQFIFVVGRNKNAINNHFDHSYELQKTLDEKGKAEELRQTIGWLPDAGSIIFTRQLQPLGLGHAVWCARHIVGDEPFAVLLPDDLVLSRTPCLKQMMDAHHTYPNSNMVAVTDVPREQTGSYGILDVGEQKGNLIEARSIIEKPRPDVTPSTKAVIGRYLLQPCVFDALENLTPGAGGEIQLTDALRITIPDAPLYGFEYEGMRYDCGNKAGFLEANLAFALEREDLRESALAMLERYYLRECASKVGS